MQDDLAFRPARELAALIADKAIRSVELTQHYIDRIEQLDGNINAVVVRTFERAIADARAADEAVARGDSLGPLHGVPMTIKESYAMQGTPSTWGLPAFKDNVSDTDGLIVQRFREAGAVFLGKTNVPVDLADFQSYNDIYGTTNNPWNTDRVPGGSSGGSAASMAAGFAGLEAGSDIGGSIRTPAAFCGVFGHKPTWGIIPQQGHELFPGVPESDLSVCGPLARDAADLAIGLDIMAGPSERERVGWKLDLPRSRFSELRDLRIAVWPSDEVAPVSAEMAGSVSDIADQLAAAGAIVSDTARPEFDVRKAHATYQSLLTAVMSSSLPAEKVPSMQARAAGFDDGDSSPDAVHARAAVMLHRDWIRHNFRRERLRRAWDAFFKQWDILLCPQFSVPAIPHDHRAMSERSINVDGVERPYMEPIFWAGLAIASYLPSTVFPTGLSDAGLPIGLQAMTGPYRDHDSIAFARLVGELTGGFTPPPGF